MTPPRLQMQWLAASFSSAMSLIMLEPISAVPLGLLSWGQWSPLAWRLRSLTRWRNSTFSVASFWCRSSAWAMARSCWSLRRVIEEVRPWTISTRRAMSLVRVVTWEGICRQVKHTQLLGLYSSRLAMQSACIHMAQCRHRAISLPPWWPRWRQLPVHSSPHPTGRWRVSLAVLAFGGGSIPDKLCWSGLLGNRYKTFVILFSD